MDDNNSSKILMQSIQHTLGQIDEDLQDKDRSIPVAIFVGHSRAGKSTLISALVGSTLIAEKKLGKMTVKVENPPKGFEFTTGFTSSTKLPTLVMDKETGVIYCDSAGFEGSEGDNGDIVNAYGLRRVVVIQQE